MSDVYLVGARYSKSRYRMLRAGGFGADEIVFRRCSICHCKIIIHPESLKELLEIATVLICGDCGRHISQTKNLVRIQTPVANAIVERFYQNVKKN